MKKLTDLVMMDENKDKMLKITGAVKSREQCVDVISVNVFKIL